MSDYILTYSKTKFYPLEPSADDIKIIDIAHALSLMTRANGHFEHFYSVAQHAINCCKEAKKRGFSKRLQLGCLLHDASESYISDLTRPVKKNLSEYFIIEDKLQGLIYEKFGIGDLSEEETTKIREIDDAMLYYEFMDLMDERIYDTKPHIAMEHDFSERNFKDVENEFIRLYQFLAKERETYSFVGIDGCKEGWVVVNITEDGFEIEVFKNIEEICLKYRDSDSIIVDMPIGLQETKNDVRPDGDARKVLSSRSSCVFNTPCRQAIYEKDYYLANETNKSILDKGISKQSFAICKKIREIDEFLYKSPEFVDKIKEGHPEVSFTMLNFNGVIARPIYENKKTEIGMQKRFEVLSRYYNKTEDIKALIYADLRLSRIKDDVIDSLCLAVTGMLGINNGFKTIPEKPMKDRRGIVMQMVYAY